MDPEITLTGGRTTPGVVRVGNTVRRPIPAGDSLTPELLRHLESRGFSGAPRYIGVDSAGREILSYVPGSVPAELGHFPDTQISAAARLLRQFHDATLDCALRKDCEVVCHGDASPCNCVFVDGVPTAFIDFDDASPGVRLDDLGYAAWLWIDIGNDELDVHQQGQRVAAFFRSYGLDAGDAIQSIISAQERLAERTSSGGVRDWAVCCRAWVEANRAGISAAIEEAEKQSWS
jgi:hypothetical protein